MSRYRTDDKFRESVRRSNRGTARRFYGLSDPSTANLEHALNNLHEYGVVRHYLLPDKSIVHELSFTIQEMCRVVGRCFKTFNFWLSDERFPRPICVTLIKYRGVHRALYSKQQAIEILKVLIEHHKEKHTLGVDDTNTRRKLLTAVYGANSVITHKLEEPLRSAA